MPSDDFGREVTTPDENAYCGECGATIPSYPQTDAPDLLVACEALLSEAVDIREGWNADRENDGWDAIDEDPCFDLARAAITFAKGKLS